VIRARQAGAWLRASDLLELIAESGTETPGLPEHGDLADPETRKAAQQATGRKLSLCFRAGDLLTLDGMTIERREAYEPASRYTVREYRFTPAAMEPDRIAEPPAPALNLPPETPAPEPELALCGYGRGYAAAMDAAMKSLCAANAADTPSKCEHSDTTTITEGNVIASMATLSRIAATPAPVAAVEMEEGEI
jgi:hypothetical protein